MMVSMHIPKTAGTSFRDLLQRHYGDRLLLDYADRPLALGSRWRRMRQRLVPPEALHDIETRYDCVHGHFVAGKYDGLDKPIRYVTWLRDPVRRTISHYRYWKRVPDLRNPDCRRLVEHDLSLEAFAALPRMRNVMSRFFGEKTPRDFFFIGTVETFDASLKRLQRLTGLAIENVPSSNRDDDVESREEIPAATVRAIERLNRRDVALYGRVREMLGT